MSLESLLDIRYKNENGVMSYADPFVVTDLAEFLKNDSSAVLENARVCRIGPALVSGFHAHSTLDTAQFIMVFDASAIPADGAVTPMVWEVAGDSSRDVAWVPYPRGFRNGVVICNSTTNATKTLGAANTLFDVQFI